jgi:hypothetical protein
MSTPFKGKHMNRDAFRKELLLTKSIELFNDYDAGEMTSVIGWLMGTHVRYVVDRGIMTEDEALGAMLSIVRAAYIAQGEKNT